MCPLRYALRTCLTVESSAKPIPHRPTSFRHHPLHSDRGDNESNNCHFCHHHYRSSQIRWNLYFSPPYPVCHSCRVIGFLCSYAMRGICSQGRLGRGMYECACLFDDSIYMHPVLSAMPNPTSRNQSWYLYGCDAPFSLTLIPRVGSSCSSSQACQLSIENGA